MAKHGLVVKGDDGSVYYLRPEILEAAKVPKDLHSHVEGATKGGHAGATVVGTIDPEAETLSASGNPKQMAKAPVTGDTIMCPW